MSLIDDAWRSVSQRAQLFNFVAESNRIEGIVRGPLSTELDATAQFLKPNRLTVTRVQMLVSILQPGALLRSRTGRDVRIGRHFPPPGGPAIKVMLTDLLSQINNGELSPYEAHQLYEALHPFMDGNGRSGRAIWLWMMKGNAPLGFLHTWYYQSLQARQ